MEKLDVSALRIAEFIALGSDMEDVLVKHDTAALGLEPVVSSFMIGFKNVSDLYGSEKGSPLSKDIELADVRRDQCIIGIKGVAENYQRHFDPAFAAAANILLRTINQYGSNIATQNYPIESLSLNQLCNELEATGEVNEALVKLGLKDWATEMRTANTVFSSIFQQRTKETSQQPTGSLKELRLAAKADYENLIDMLDALKLVSPSSSLTGLIKELNTVIGKYNELLASRHIFGA